MTTTCIRFGAAALAAGLAITSIGCGDHPTTQPGADSETASAADERPAPDVGGPATRRTPAGDVNRLLGTDWYGVYLVGKKIGWMSNTMSKSADGTGYEVATSLRAHFSVGGATQVMEVDERRTYTGPDHRLTRVETTQAVGASRTEIVGSLEGDTFTFAYTSAGVTRTRTIPAPTETIADTVREQALAADLAALPGTRVSYPNVEALRGEECTWVATLDRREEVVLAGVKTTVAFISAVNKETGLKAHARITADGRILEATIGASLVQRLEPEAVAKRIEMAVDPFALGTIRLRKSLPDVTEMQELVLVISGLDDPRTVIRSDRQIYEKTDEPGEYRLTLRRSTFKPEDIKPGPYDPETFKAALAPTPFIQSDDPRIARLAKEIVGDEADPLRRVEKLVHWVYRNLKKEYVAALPSALDVQDTRKGDCTEHTILFVALCRALGIPAEELCGVIYLPRLAGFGYHAWARVYLGTWIEADPTFNEPVANPARIAFGVGPLERQTEITAVIGKVGLRYVSHKND